MAVILACSGAGQAHFIVIVPALERIGQFDVALLAKQLDRVLRGSAPDETAIVEGVSLGYFAG